MIVIFDIDGTVADISHRLHWIDSKPKNWQAFYSAMDKDQPIDSMCELARRSHAAGDTVLFCTGRSQDYRTETETWLAAQGLKYSALFMRPRHDFRKDFEVKLDLLNRMRALFGEPDLVFEDRQQVVDMWRSQGIRCLQVAEGQY